MTSTPANSNMDIPTVSSEISKRRDADHIQLRSELDGFFREAQPRAFRMLQFALHNEQLSLDLLQDVMLAFVRRYAQRPAEQRAPLFYRMLQNRLRDHFRRKKTRGRWLNIFSDMGRSNDEPDHYEPEAIEPKPEAWQQLDTQHKMEYLDRAVGRLGMRQQQTFLLRAWEGLSEAETAAAMGISVGSVKTHYARARAALRASLGMLELAEMDG